MKIAIVSSYNEGEANSEYTKAIKTEFEAQGHVVEILRLPFNIFGSTSSIARKQADLLVEQYAKQLSNFDYVNIHYEFLLYGCREDDVLRRVLKLIRACKNNKFSVVFHNFPEGKILSPWKLKLRRWQKKENQLSVVQSILHIVEQKQGKAIVHIFRHQRYIEQCCPKLKVVVHPLRYKTNEELQKQKGNFSKNSYMKEMGIKLSDKHKVISVIGTLHFYKDISSVVRALNILPENYHLFIFGGMHKLSFSSFPTGLPFIDDAQNLIESLDLINRVHFMGFQETSEDFSNACLFSDYIVLPYIEIGGSASAATYTALELCEYVFCTRNNRFGELDDFFYKSGTEVGYFQYDMGNYLELAEKIKTLPKEKKVLESRKHFLTHYSISENIKSYLPEEL